MKSLLFLFALCQLSVATEAQNSSAQIDKFRESIEYRKALENKWRTNPNDTIFNLREAPFSTGALTPGIRRLPQDGMPCVVPDTKDIVAIPNAFKGKVSIPFTGNAPHIPNPIGLQLFSIQNNSNISALTKGKK